jgi:hypothetical protein
MPADIEKDSKTWYNNNQDEQRAVKVDMKGKKPINDPNCAHKWFVDEADADSAWSDVVKCKNCPVGRLFAKGVGHLFVEDQTQE